MSRRSLIRAESSVAAMESSPADMRGASEVIVVPRSSEAETARLWVRQSRDCRA